MQKLKLRYLWGFVALVVAASFGGLQTTWAQSSSSTNYKVNETQFGAGNGSGCSTTYCAKATIGDATVGSAKSANYTAKFGSNTTNVPLLEIITIIGLQNLGTLDVSHTTTTSSEIKVRNYISGGYIIQLTGTAPDQGSYALKRMNTPSTSQAGVEQFGVNMAANTSPGVGASVKQVPNSDVSHGYVTDDYSTPNLFKYINGDIIARSDTSSGETDYTLSVIVNVSNVTPGGHYDGALSAVVVPLY